MTATAAGSRSLTLADLARRLRVPRHRLELLLADDVARGVVEQDGDRFRLTADAEREHGEHLRGITWNR